MEIPRGFGRINQAQIVAETTRISAGELTRVEREADEFQRGMGRLAQMGERFRREKEQQQAENDRAKIVSAQAEMTLHELALRRQLNETAVERPLTDQDVAAYANELRRIASEMDVPESERERFIIATETTIAKIESDIAIARAKQEKQDLVESIGASILELIDNSEFDAADLLIDDSRDLLSDAAWRRLRRASVETRVTSTVDDLLGSYSDADIKAAQDYVQSISSDTSVPASMRNAVQAAARQRLSTHVAEARRAAREAERDARLDRLERTAELEAYARHGIVDPETGERQYLLPEQIDEMFAAGAIDARTFNTLMTAAKSNQAKVTAREQSYAAATEAVQRGDPGYAHMDPNRRANAQQMYADLFDNALPNTYSSWEPEQKAKLLHLMELGYRPPQVDALLDFGRRANTDPATVQSALELWNDAKARDEYSLGTVTKEVRSFYESVNRRIMAGGDVATAVAEAHRPIDKAVRDMALQNYRGIKNVQEKNQDFLVKRMRADEGLRAQIPPEMHGQLKRLETNMALQAQFERSVADYFVMTNDIDSAREAAYGDVMSRSRPTTFNGFPELMPSPPEYPAGGDAPPVPVEFLRAQFDEEMATIGVAAEGERLAIQPVPGRVAPNGAPLYFVVRYPEGADPTAAGLTALDPTDGQPLLWYPDYDNVGERMKARQAEIQAESEAKARDFEALLRLGEEIAKDPGRLPMTPREQEALTAYARRQNYVRSQPRRQAAAERRAEREAIEQEDPRLRIPAGGF